MKRFFNILSSILITIILTTYTSIVFASTETDLKNKQNEQSNVSNNIKKTEEELENVKEEKNDALTEVSNLTNQIEDYQTQIDELDSKINSLQEKINEAQLKIEEEERKQQERQELLNERLVAIYENGEISYLDVLLSANNIIDFISGYYLVSEITRYDNELLKEIEETKKTIETEKAEIEKDKESLDNSKKTKEAKENALKVARNEKEKKVSELSQDEKDLQSRLDELRSYENSIKKEVEKLKQEYDKKTSSSSSSKNTATSSFGFILPVSSYKAITARYGQNGSSWAKKHTGIDFAVGDGTSVYAVGDGMVVQTGHLKSSYGNHIAIYHGKDKSGKDIYSFYAHATSLNVSTGDVVKKGQLIMLSGHTGNVTGPHLHFEIRRGSNSYGACVNPEPYLPL